MPDQMFVSDVFALVLFLIEIPHAQMIFEALENYTHNRTNMSGLECRPISSSPIAEQIFAIRSENCVGNVLRVICTDDV